MQKRKVQKEYICMGVGDHVKYQLSEKHKETIKSYILPEENRKTVTRDSICCFMSSIEHAISTYKVATAIAEKCLPSEVRSNLTGIQKKVLGLVRSLNKLDGVSRHLITEAGGSIDDIYQSTAHLSDVLLSAVESSNNLPTSRKNILNYPERDIAVKIAIALEDDLGITPTKTKEGLYHAILSNVLTIATGKEITDPYRLAEKAIDDMAEYRNCHSYTLDKEFLAHFR